MTLLKQMSKLLLVVSALSLNLGPSVPVSGGDGIGGADNCGNTAALDCNAENPSITCNDSVRWDAAESQPQTFGKSNIPLDCKTVQGNGNACLGSGWFPVDADPKCN